jgi:release factor glutamine methyltransferase
VTYREALTQAIATLEHAGIGSAKLDAELLLAHVTGHDRAWLLAHDTDDISDSSITALNSLITQRSQRIPLVHLTHTREFYGLDFEISPDVLTPRVETEAMVDYAIKYAPKRSRLIDIGTGSGALAIAIATRRPDLKITATDVTSESLSVAHRNAIQHEVDVTFIQSDLWQHVPGMYDTVVTNLPYLQSDADLMPEVKREPAVALFGGPDGLDIYRKLLASINDHLTPGGFLMTECDPWQHEALTELCHQQNLNTLEDSYFIQVFQSSSAE